MQQIPAMQLPEYSAMAVVAPSEPINARASAAARFRINDFLGVFGILKKILMSEQSGYVLVSSENHLDCNFLDRKLQYGASQYGVSQFLIGANLDGNA